MYSISIYTIDNSTKFNYNKFTYKDKAIETHPRCEILQILNLCWPDLWALSYFWKSYKYTRST